jgi:radical SAM superfamily enzyme YgiQ (UPF0313 family)
MRITFIYPDFESLGVGYLMSVCRQKGHEVEFVHYSAENPYFDTKNKGLSHSRIARVIAATRPDVAGFSCVTDNYRHQLQIAAELKRLLPEVITLFGGVHSTSVPERVIERAEVDSVAIGEAEISLPELLEACRPAGNSFRLPENAVKGIVFKNDGRLIGTFEEGDIVHDLDTLPFPYKQPFVEALRDAGTFYFVITSRGCPFRCSYCYNSYCMQDRGGPRVRHRSVDNVIQELLWAKANFPIGYILFLDDCFTTNTPWLTDFCERYKKEVGLPFWCLTHPLYLNWEKIKLLKRAGCNSITIGVQSLSQEINQRILQRQSDRLKIAEDIKAFKRCGILVQVDHILGIPEDSLPLEEEAILYYAENKPDILSVFWLTYYPKVAMLDIAKEKGILTDGDIERLEEGFKITPGNFHLGGSVRDSKDYYSVSLLLNYVPLLPKFLIRFLVKSHLYRMFRVKNFYLAVALPRFLISLINKRDIIGRSNIVRFINTVFHFR